jgi:hypothetical protein
MGRVSSISKLIGINVAGLALALVAGEMALRIAKPPALQARLKMNELMRQGPTKAQGLFNFKEFRFVPNSRGQQLHNEYQHSVQHDHHGWRNPCFDFNRPATAVAIGDSYTYGIGVSDEDLMQCQASRTAKEQNIYALGLPGANIPQYINILRTQADTIREVNPNNRPIDLMLCMGNDYEGLLAYGATESAQGNQPADALPSLTHTGLKAKLSGLNSWIMEQPLIADLHLLQATKLALMQSGNIKDHGSYYSNYGGQTFYKTNSPDNSKELRNALDRIKTEFKSEGFELGQIIMIPDGSDVSKERLRRDGQLGGFTPKEIDVDHKYNALSQACSAENIRCVDFRSQLSGSDYYDFDGHFRPNGVAVMGQAFTNAKAP